MNKQDKRNIPFSPPDISEKEIEEVINTLDSGWITTGPKTKLLERRLAAYILSGDTSVDCDSQDSIKRYSNRVVCLNSATAAEELNLRICGIGSGDEVIVPAYTYTATASAVIHCGATVKFVDVKRNGCSKTHIPEMDYDQLERMINSKTKAIIAVDFGGIVCDYERILSIVEKKKSIFVPLVSDGTPLSDLSARIQKSLGRVIVLSDGAHSLGSNRLIFGQRLFCGNIADFTSFSFHAVKNFTTAEGGAAIWKPITGIDDSEIYRYYQLLSLHGQNKDALAKTKSGAWEYDIIGPWYKCNMTDVMAAIGLRQLDRYYGLIERRKEIVKKYDELCDNLGIFHLNHHTDMVDSNCHLYIIRIDNLNVEMRNNIIDKMAECGIVTNVHYKPLPMMSAYKYLGWNINNFPNSYEYYQNLISLPLNTKLSDSDIDYICVCLRDIMNSVRGKHAQKMG